MSEKSLVDQARELLEYTLRLRGPNQAFLHEGDLLLFLEAVIPLLEHAQIDAEHDSSCGLCDDMAREAKERRTLALAQMAAVLLANDSTLAPSYSDIDEAVDEANELLREAEKRGE